MKRLFCIAFIVVGFLFLSAAAFLFPKESLNSHDEMTAVSPLVRIPLDQLANSGSAAVIVTIPHNAQWARIRRQWGDPSYFVGAVEYPKTAPEIRCLDQLGIAVEIRTKTGIVPLKPAKGPPYGYSARCPDAGFEFRAPAGTDLTIRASSPRDPMPAGELIVLCDWDNLKDKIVGVMLAESFRKMAWYCAGVGLAMTLAGSFALVHRSRARKMDTPPR
jgi:hypothetical protein